MLLIRFHCWRALNSGWQRIADYDGSSGALQNRYVYGTGLDEPLIQVSAGGTITYYHHDRMGSIVAVSNSSGVTTNVNTFGPYGETTALGGTTFGYTAQRYDSELGLYYYKNRYYSQQIGRFLQTDPLGLSAGLNLYEYASSSPLVYSDPLGLEPSGGELFGLLPKFFGVDDHLLPSFTFSIPFQGAPAGAYTPQIQTSTGSFGYAGSFGGPSSGSSEASSGNKEGGPSGGQGGSNKPDGGFGLPPADAADGKPAEPKKLKTSNPKFPNVTLSNGKMKHIVNNHYNGEANRKGYFSESAPAEGSIFRPLFEWTIEGRIISAINTGTPSPGPDNSTIFSVHCGGCMPVGYDRNGHDSYGYAVLVDNMTGNIRTMYVTDFNPNLPYGLPHRDGPLP